ncbi:hypothetical protein HY621_02960 [Candidatus Uhrbacteria bacterium]|nr:hypothetical protein [Candidatus Uhrbacteria bacterium]
MHLWDYQKTKKKTLKKDEIWYLRRMLTYGLNGDKLDEKMVKRNWHEIKDTIPPNTRAVLELLIWDKPF